MNDILELWSVPWHALQRSLAEAFGVESTATPPAAAPSLRSGPAARARVDAAGPTESLSWLARAHLQLRQTV
jgi:hypothetical protein